MMLEKNKLEKVFDQYVLVVILGTLISLLSVEVGINLEGVQKLPNH